MDNFLSIVGNGSPEIWLKLGGLPPHSILEQLLPLRLHPRQAVELHYSTSTEPYDNLDVSFFRLWPGVEYVHLGCQYSQALQMVENLVRPQESAHGATEWLWPNLRSIKFGYSIWKNWNPDPRIDLRAKLLEVVANRKENGRTVVSP